MIQRGDDWLEWRRAGIGGSDAPAILGVSPWRTIHDVYRDKTGEGPPEFVNPAMQRGLDLEAEARRAYEAQTGFVVEPCTLEHPEWPIMRASFDGLSWGREITLEIKCPNVTSHERARLGKVPDHYMPQVQHLLAVSGSPVCHYWSYHPEHPPALVVVESDPVYQAMLMEKERAFWGYVERREMPPGFVPPEDERTDADWVETARLYREAEAGYAEWDGKRKAARERLIALAGQSTRQQGGGLTLTKLRKQSVDYKALALAYAPRADIATATTNRDEWRVTIAKEKA